jgi:signal transduction histidine kinase
MTSARFRFTPDILRRLGEELNPNPDQGILELVKNAYDADATWCEIQLCNVEASGGTIVIADSGDGMDENDILSGWLVLGRSRKAQGIRSDRLRRIPAGSKGLGRLAALRMGKSVILRTRPRSEPQYEYFLRINWPDFDQAELVDDVALKIRKSIRPAGAENGTVLRIDQLTNNIGRPDVKRLARSLILLADPFEDNPVGFSPTLVAPEFDDLAKQIQNKYFSDAEYYLTATVDEDGYASAMILDYKSDPLFTASHEELTVKRKGRPYICPPATFDLWVFLLDTETFSTRHITPLKDVRDWLKSFGGVHLYQNRLRIGPYGDTGNDWLDMNLRRSQHQQERPSTNTVIGRVSITGVYDELVQKTDRTGFIETEPFQELRAFAQDAMEWLAARRMAMAIQRREQTKVQVREQKSRSRTRVEAAIANLPQESRIEIEKAFTAYDQTRTQEVQELRKDIQLYRTLSTAGIIASTFAHESTGGAIKAVGGAIQTIERRGLANLGSLYETTLKDSVELIKRSIVALSVLGSTTLSIINSDKRRWGRVDIHRVIGNVLQLFRPFIEGRDVEVITQLCDGSPYLRGSQAAIESILSNLLNNSLIAFEFSDRSERTVLIRTEVTDQLVCITVIDSGLGIVGISLDDIWLPGKTTRDNGTGLGLAIVRDTVTDLGGSVKAMAQSDELGGAQFTIRLPILGA